MYENAQTYSYFVKENQVKQGDVAIVNTGTLQQPTYKFVVVVKTEDISDKAKARAVKWIVQKLDPTEYIKRERAEEMARAKADL